MNKGIPYLMAALVALTLSAGWAAPVLGTIGGIFILIVGMTYLEWRRRVAARNGEGYAGSEELRNEPEPFTGDRLAHPLIAILPLLLVGVANFLFTRWIPGFYGESQSFVPAVIGGRTLFARMQQFGGRVYGPVIGRGVDFTSLLRNRPSELS